MIILKLSKTNYSKVLRFAVNSLKKGKTVVYPTDTSYGLAALVSNKKAIDRMYKIKERGFNKPVHIFVSSVVIAKKYVQWNIVAEKLAKKFLPGPLSIALPLKSKNKTLKKLTGSTGYLGIRIAKNNFALDLAKQAGPITATSANFASEKGGFDPYSSKDVLLQFKDRKLKPDIIIDAGKLKKIKPSTFIKVSKKGAGKQEEIDIEILRQGPISEKQIFSALK
ncbi:MAG: tRNA threonylcarbamoyladenosine biosynthesis protein [Candidatus Doudnabacteria bacterium Gr01-1014_77]|uniref:L-threonylcarbamoyladenylate synthase n=1 Tax=Candidatus Doudnabacteria bacterium Gr01-1014_77 TaxID=2017133 RepID=A0A554JDV7_9BACT|nr:MAG: tRNA threonylcarbamoyladenosine biosynthesis protein [Candidatus Doudnabacteria bacterium Gr01-1014_77]